jgi:hypothetical protein
MKTGDRQRAKTKSFLARITDNDFQRSSKASPVTKRFRTKSIITTIKKQTILAMGFEAAQTRRHPKQKEIVVLIIS